MREFIKNELLLLTDMLAEVQDEIKKYIKEEKGDIVIQLLIVNQEAIDKIMNVVNESNDMSEQLYQYFDLYCEVLFDISQKIESNNYEEASRILKVLYKTQLQIQNYIRNQIQVRKEIVFLPYNASMWDSLESIWKAADEDESCDAYVIPIPFYGRNSDGSFKEMQYEGELFPKYVPITHFNDYDFEKNRPHTIFFHNPYDGNNIVTSVHPFFYSSNLKNFTDNLVYVPYFVLEEVDAQDKAKVSKIAHFCLSDGVVNAHKVVVQSENFRQIYIDTLTSAYGEKYRVYWENKILGLGSPKFDKAVDTEIEIPKEWAELAIKKDGTKKNIIFYNTSINGLLMYGKQYILKMQEVFDIFKNNSEEVTLLWRPHPLMKETLQSMQPHLWEMYREITEKYITEKFGIYDDTPDLNRAIEYCDLYYGDMSSVTQLCIKLGKPVMIQFIVKEEI